MRIKMPSRRDQAVEQAMLWINTPYHHHACVRGVGVDCAMLVYDVAYQIGCITKEQYENPPQYNAQWHIHNNKEMLIEIIEGFGCTPSKTGKAGDIAVFKYGRSISHMGILVNQNQIVHARMDMGKVVLNTINGELLERFAGYYKFPGVE